MKPYTNTANKFVSDKYRLSSMAMKDGPNFEALSLLGVSYKTAASSSTCLINVCQK